jgi:hypothetical protein
MDETKYDELQDRLREYYPKIDKKLTEWITSIRKATIEILLRDEPFREDKKVIQVKHLNQNDLPTEEAILDGGSHDETLGVQGDEAELVHEFDSRLDVIKLPRSCPFEDKEYFPAYLFIRPDEYALFIILTNKKRTILIGNPGISKSWFQYKFILFSYRPDLFDLLWSCHSPRCLQVQTGNEKDGSMEQLHEERKDKLEGSPLKKYKTDIIPKRPVYPSHIVRTLDGTESYIFHIGFGVEYDVQVIKNHTPQSLKWCTDEESTILWEPGSSTNPIEYEVTFAKILATVSPRVDTYKYFARRAQKFYMPCPSEIHIRLMGKIMHEVGKVVLESNKISHIEDRMMYETNDSMYPSDKEVCERIKLYGPFIRTSIVWNALDLGNLRTETTTELNNLCANNYADLIAAINSTEHIFSDSKTAKGAIVGFSFRIMRFDVNRNATDISLPYGTYSYTTCSKETRTMIAKKIRKIPMEKIKENLITYQEGILTGSNDTWLFTQLEKLFVGYSVSNGGLKWKCRKMLSVTESGNSWVGKSFEFKEGINMETVPFQELVKGVVYYPIDKQFPLVDVYWKVSDTVLACVQATKSCIHAKPVSVYKAFLQRLGLTMEADITIEVYFLSLPHNETHFLQEAFPPSQFWYDYKKNASIVEVFKKKFKFYALLPPYSFNAVDNLV